MAELLFALNIFILATFVGFEVISKVPRLLHTPLMSGSNAISGISIIGAIVIAGEVDDPLRTILGFFAVILGAINVFGGFVVTDRMLQMFRRQPGDDRRPKA
jgi:NAD(P) transhydrogenase subunit alpha